jgi:hypothetical protein
MSRLGDERALKPKKKSTRKKKSKRTSADDLLDFLDSDDDAQRTTADDLLDDLEGDDPSACEKGPGGNSQVQSDLMRQDITMNGGRLSEENRNLIWQSLLFGRKLPDAKNNELSLDDIPKNIHDRVILADVKRTGNKEFQAKHQSRMHRLLTYFCYQRQMRYRQGLNEVLAPLVALRDPPLPDSQLLLMLDMLSSKFLSNAFFDDEEFTGLQASFRLFQLLLMFHDATLAEHLQRAKMTPDLYATGWFMTLFSIKVDP